jgi:hypothetical protein
MGAILLLCSPWHWLALVGALLLACVPVGAAVTCWVDTGDGIAQVGLTLVLSLAAFALGSSILIWSAVWHPDWLLALAVVGAVSCLVRLVRGAGR